ncbi:MAG: hypothetical protein GY717_01050 [Rhodobacteraceae bacterium]|nr:hypothetical protein [Paracoccaceae bacterium]
MIDDPAKTYRLTVEMEASLPLETRLSPGLKRTLAKQSPETTIPDRCMVKKVFYMGDEGGISCHLDIGGPDSKTPFIVSITHLIFDRRCPLFRQIEAYQRHRVKKLKRQSGRGY